MNILSEKITETLSNAPSGVHSVIYTIKKTDGNETGEYALVHYVEQKLPLSALPIDQVIPKVISFENKNYKTDVVEKAKFKALQCNTLDAQNVRFLQTYHRPLSGGLEIANLASIGYYNNGQISVGTLGFIAVDNIDNTLVGVTNLHVAILDGFNSAERNPNGQVFNTYSPIYLQDNLGNRYTVTNTTAQFGTYNNQGTFILDDSIGRPKRYMPLTTNGTNNLDCALIALNVGTADNTSSCQAELIDTYALPFATTNEINTVLAPHIGNLYPIYSVGRTTGPKGTNCPMEIFAYGSAYVAYNMQGLAAQPNEISVLLSDLLFYRYQDQSNLPIYSGDSGSAVVVNINGQNKIIGLAFAGDTSSPNGVPTSTEGIMCRIDNIASQMNISAWDGSFTNFTSNTQQSISHIVRPTSDNRTSISYNGKTYYQAGLVLTNQTDTNA